MFHSRKSASIVSFHVLLENALIASRNYVPEIIKKIVENRLGIGPAAPLRRTLFEDFSFFPNILKTTLN